MKLLRSSKYYQKAREGSLDVNHPGMKILIKLGRNARKILDLGCGEGTRLAIIAKENGVGVDISPKAINLAKKSYPHLIFRKMDLKKLLFKDNEFDLVYSAFVLEHLENPEKVIKEAIRVTAFGGNLVFIAPNYGAPNRASPVFRGSRINKFISGFIKDLTSRFTKVNSLGWNKVKPVKDAKMYQIDYDTSVEPYAGSLIVFLRQWGCKILITSTCWEEELPNAKFHQKFFRILAGLRIYPFYIWGPHFVVVAQK